MRSMSIKVDTGHAYVARQLAGLLGAFGPTCTANNNPHESEADAHEND